LREGFSSDGAWLEDFFDVVGYVCERVWMIEVYYCGGVFFSVFTSASFVGVDVYDCVVEVDVYCDVGVENVKVLCVDADSCRESSFF